MRSTVQWTVGARVCFAFALTALLVLTLSAQQSPAPANNPANFTGKSVPLDSGDLRAARRHFEAGARTNWHVHSSMQLLLAEKGRGRAQEAGGAIVPLVAGRPVYMRAGVRHWHGADPDQEMVQIGVTIPGGKEADWQEAVGDAVYLGKK